LFGLKISITAVAAAVSHLPSLLLETAAAAEAKELLCRWNMRRNKRAGREILLQASAVWIIAQEKCQIRFIYYQLQKPSNFFWLLAPYAEILLSKQHWQCCLQIHHHSKDGRLWEKKFFFHFGKTSGREMSSNFIVLAVYVAES